MKCDLCQRDNLTQRELDVHKKYYHGVKPMSSEQPQRIASGVCPECGTTLFYQEGCTTCHGCGFSKCG